MSWIQRIHNLTGDPVRLSQWFILCRQSGILLSSIVIARSLTLSQVGQVEMLMMCGYLMTFFWSDALLKGYLASNAQPADKLKSSAFLWFFFIASLAAMIILVSGQKILLPLLVDRKTLYGLGIFALFQAFIIPVWTAPFLGLLKGQKLVLLSIYVLVGPSFACWAGIMSMPELPGVLIGLLSYALVGFGWVLTSTSILRELRLKEMLLSVWPATWPLVMYAFSVALARSFDAWLVARYFDESSFAIFRYGAREFPVVLAFAAGLSTMMIPRLKSNEGLEELRARSSRLMHLCLPLVAVVMFTSPWWFTSLFGPAFAESAFIFNIYLLLSLTQLVFPQSVMTARGDTKLLWYISIAELVVNVTASLLLLKYFGLMGIAWGTCIAFGFEKVVLILFLNRRYGIRPGSIVNLPVWLIYAVLLFLVFILTKWMFGT